MTSGQLPAWFTNYWTFMDKLQHLFSLHDIITDTMNSLKSLKLKDSRKATKYTIKFNCYTWKMERNEQVLFHQYYKNLLGWLKDKIACIGKSMALKTLQDLVATLDQCYWECQLEISRDKKASNINSNSNSTNKSTASDNIPAVNSLEVLSRTTDSSNGTKTNRSQSINFCHFWQ